MSNWIDGVGPQNDIILSSRVRLARNLNNTPFPGIINKESGAAIIEKIYNNQTKNEIFSGFTYYDMQDSSLTDRYVLVERHLISPHHDFIKNS